MEKGKVAFEIEKKGYTFKATYLMFPKNDALIEIFKGNNLIKEFLFPAYKIWNIAAHIYDIIDGLEEESDYGLRIAGSDGLGGNCYTKQNKGGLTMSHQVKTIDCIHEKACDKIADWDGDDETIPCSGCARYIEGKMYYEKAPQNLPEADAYSLLADVRAWLKQNAKDPDTFYVDEQVVSVDRLDDFLFKYISEHFS